MNRIYKVIWSKTKHCYVVVSELAKRHAKGGSAGGCRMMTARVLSTLLLGAYLVGGYSLPSAWADGDPNEAEVAAGDKIAGGSNVTVSKNENTITISATDTTYTAGDGLQLLDGTTFSVKADGNTIAVGSNGIKVNADGTIASGDTGIVTGGAVYDVTQPLIEKIGGITRDGMKTTIEQGFTVQTNFSSGSSNGYMNVYWGQDTLANGENATAWGKSTVARSPRSTAWGNEATAKGDQATAFGSRTTAYGVNSTAWGADTVAFSHQATAFGENTTAGGQRATAWGHKTTAGGDSSTAYGKETSALMEGATAWGNNTKAGRWTYTDDNGVVHDALVIQPYTDVHNGSEMYEIVDAVTGEQIHNGENDYIDAYDWLAAKGTVNGVYSTAWGNGTEAEGDYSTAFGNFTKTAAVTSFKYNGIEAKVVESEEKVLDEDGNPIPLVDPATGEVSDTEFKTETKYKIVDADGNKLYESYFDTEDAAMKEIALNGTITGGYGATAFGLYSEANGAHSTAFGVQTVAEGIGATAWGNSTTASGKGATASGYGTKAEGDYSTAFGNNTTTAAVTSLKYRDPYNNDDWTEAKIITKNTDTGLKYVIVEAADPNKELYFSYFDTEDAAMNQIALDGKIIGGYGATAFGLLSEAKGAHSTAFGVETVAEGTGATAWGRKAKATGDYSTAWGFNTEAINDKSTAFGDNTIAGGKIATAWGYKTAAGGRTSTAFGSETVALTEGATAWGNNTKAGKWTYAGHDVFIKKEGDGRYHIIDEYGNSGSNGLPGQTFVSYDEAYKELSTNGTVQGVYATAWGKDTKAEGDYSTAFGNYTKTAAVTSLKYNGTEAKVVSEVVVVNDANGNPVMITDPSHPESGEKIPATELKYTIVNANDPEEKLSDTYFDSEDAAMNEIVQNGTITGGYGATAFGLLTEAKGAHSTAFGVRTTAGGIGATAWGNGAQATGDYSTAFGNGSVANASNSLAALGGTTAEDAANSLAVGLGAQTTLPDSIALGSGAVADRAKYDGTDNKYTAYLGDETGETKTGSAWRSTANAIAIGHIDTTDDTKSVTRQIIDVAAGTEDTDAVNVAQLKAATFDMQGITRTETGTPGEAGYVATTTIENNLSVSSDGKVKWGNNTKVGSSYYVVTNEQTNMITKTEAKVVEYKDTDNNTKYKIVDASGSTDLDNNNNQGYASYAAAYEKLTTEGTGATAWGNGTKAGGDYSTAGGYNTKAMGKNATAFGNYTQANGYNSTAFGNAAKANGQYTTAFGSTTQANGQYATAFGSNTEANGYNSTAFGNYTQANGQYATAFGSSSIAAGDYSTAFGSYTQAGKLTYKKEDGSETEAKIVEYTTAAGDRKYKIVSLRNENDVLSDNGGAGFYYYDVLRDSNLTKQGDYSTAFGSSTEALGDYSTAFGSNTKATGDNSTAFGSSTKATGSSSTAFGSITEANGPSGTAFGSSTMANGQHSTAFGSSSIAAGYISTAFGSNTQAGKLTYKKADGSEAEAKIVEYTTAAGDRKYKIVSLRNENDVLSDNNGAGFNMYDSAFLDNNLTRQGDYSTAFGSSTKAFGTYSTAFGSYTEASGTGATAWGSETKAGGNYSTAFGSSTEASGTGATAWGSGTKAGGTYSTAFGNGSVANAYNSLAALGGTTGEKSTNSVAIGRGATVGGAYDSENQQTEGANAFAFGNGAQATLSDSVALGSGAVANRAKYNASNNAYKAYLNEDDNNQKTDPAWRATHNAIAVGASATDSDTATVTRQITGVAAGTYDTDAVNVAQLKAATVDLDNIQGINRRRNEEDDGFNTTIEGTFSVWDDGRFGTSDFAVDKDGAFNAAGGKFSVDENGNTTAAGTLSAGATTVSELTVGEKNRTVELITDGEVTDGDAGAGYVKGSTVYSAMNTKLGDYAKLDGTNLDAAYAEAWGAIGTGAVESGNGKLVTGDTVYSAMNTTLGDYAKLNGSNLDTAYAEAWGAIGTGAVESGNGKLVTGDTVYSAMNTTLGDYAKLNGSNLDTAYAEAWGAIGTGAVESGNGKLVTGDTVYSAMSTTLGDYAKLNGSNLDTAYAEAWGAIGTGAVESGNGKLVTGDTVYSAMSTTLGDYAKLNGSNLDTAYAEAWGAIGTGAVESGNGKLVTGDTVFAVTNALSDRIGTIASDGNYISASGSVSENLISLDNQVKANTSDITVAALNEGSYGYISAGHDVAGNLIALDNAVKANAGAIQGVERTGNATDGFTTTIEGKLSVSSNGTFSISGDKFTVDSNGAISAAGGKFTVGADGTLSAKATTVSELTVGDSGKVTVGSATLNTDGLAISGGPSVTSDGIDAGGKKITNVLKGEAGTDAVTVEQLHEAFDAFTTTGGTALGFGKGIAKNNDILEVNAGEGLTFADNGALKVNAGGGLTIDAANENALKVNAGEGLTIDTENGNVLKVNKGTITSGDEGEGFVTGKTVFNALSAYAKSDGATLTNATISTGSIITEEVMLGTGETAVPVGTVRALNETVNGPDGLVEKVADNTREIGVNAGNISDLQGITQNITLSEGTTTISGALSAGATTVSGLTVGDRNVTEALTTTGSVAEDNKGFVSGGTVFAVTSALDTRLDTAEGNLTTAGENITALQAKTQNITLSEGTTTISGALSAGATTVSGLTVGDRNVTEALTTTGSVAEDNKGFVSGGTVFAVTSALDTRLDTAEGNLTTAGENITALQAKTQNITLSEGTTTISGALSAGATTVSGLTVGDRNVTEALTTTGSVAEDNKGFVSGGKVFAVTDALDTRLSTAEEDIATNAGDIATLQTTVAGKANAGTTLAEYGITDAYTKTAADDTFAKVDAANLSAANITAWGTALDTGTIAADDTGLVSGGKVFAVTDALDTRLSTAEEDIATNAGDIETLQTAVAGKANAGTTLAEYGITDAYTKTAADDTFAKVDATNLSAANITAWGTALDTGTIAADDTGLVSGGKVFAVTDALDTRLSTAEEDIAANAGDIETLQTAVAGKANAGTTLEEYGITDAYTKTTADNTFAKVDAANLSAANITAWGTALDTGTIAADDTGLVSGGKVFAVTDALDTRLSTAEEDIAANAGDIATLQTTVSGHTTAIDTINTSITGINSSISSLSTGKANVDLGNISDTGKAAVRSLISVAQGNNVTVTKSTSDTGVDTYTISTAGGVTYSAGDGIAISDTNAISVAANGLVEENNTGIVTGGAVYSALQAFKPDGKVEEGNAKAVSGGTVFTAIETAKTDVNAATETKIATAKTDIGTETDTKIATAKTDITNDMDTKLASKANASDVYTKAETYSQAEVDATLAEYVKTEGATLTGATLTNATLTNAAIGSGSIAEEVTIGTGDSAITVGSLKSSVATNANSINTLSTTVSGHTASISALDATVNDADTGLVKKVGDNTASIGKNASNISSLQATVGNHTAEIGTINSSITNINNSITALGTNKANVGLDNITDAGKSVVRGLAKESVKVVAGTYTTVSQGTDGNADAYTVNVTANGIVDSNNTGLVTGGAVYSALQAFKPDGKVEKDNAKAVSGGTVYSAIETAKTAVNAETDTKLASKANASDVYTKAETYSQAEVDATLADYVKTEGATLTNATIGSGSIADTVMLGDSISVGGLKSSLSENTSAISSLKSTVGDANSGLVKDVKDNKNSIDVLTTTVGDANSGLVKDVKDSKADISLLKSKVGDENSGLVKDVKDNKNSIDVLTTIVGDANSGLVEKVNTNEFSIKTLQDKTQNMSATEGATTINGTLSAGATTVTSLTDGTATLSGGALAGVTTITASGTIAGGSLDVGTGAITGGMATVTGLTIGETNVTTALTTEGAVAANNAGFVTGGVVYSALQAYQPDGVIEDGNTKAVSGGTVYKVTSELDERITANAEAIATKADASTVAVLSDKVSANETVLAQKADKANTLKGYGIEDAYTKEDSDTLLNKKADKTEFEAVKVVVGDANSGLVKDVNDLKNASQNITADDQGNTKVDGTLVVEDTIVVQGKDVTSQLITDGKVEDNNHGYLDGDKVYDYLNKGKDSDGKVKLATESKQISMGKGSEASGEESIAIGNEAGGQTNTASGKQSIAIGFGNRVTGDHSGAIGDPSTIDGTNSYSVGNSNKVADGSDNVFVLGNNVNVTGSNTVVLGGSSDGTAMNVSGNNSVVLGAGSDGSEDNVISVGAEGNERRITHVAPGETATDAATVGQVQDIAQGAYNNAVYLNNSINKVDNRLNKVGAGAAALAALHPLDTDDKFTMGLGYGNYRSANAMAMGMFYRPTDKMMISVGGAFGNGENMINAGISFALDKNKGFNTSKALMARDIKALSAENAAIKEENADMKKQLNAQDAKLTTQEAEIQALKAALARLEAKIGK